MLEEKLQGLLLKECVGGSALFFVHHILFFDVAGVIGLNVALVWLTRQCGWRLPFGSTIPGLIKVNLVLLLGCFYIAVNTTICTQMNGKVLPEYINMISQGMDWRSIAIRTNELARNHGCIFHQIFYSDEQCRRYFLRYIVNNVEKRQLNIPVGDGEDTMLDHKLAWDAVNKFRHNEELKGVGDSN